MTGCLGEHVCCPNLGWLFQIDPWVMGELAAVSKNREVHDCSI